MFYQWGAMLVAILHLAFILFVVTGALLLLRWPRIVVLHLPAVVWGVLIEFAGWYCPLTGLENYLLRKAGQNGYSGGFVAHYIFPLIYPSGLTRGVEIALGLLVLIVNLTLYKKAFL